MTAGTLGEADLADIDTRLSGTDTLLRTEYPGDDGSRQPVHTLYVPADRFRLDLPTVSGRAAADAVAAFGGTVALAQAVGLGHLAAELAPLVDAKLEREPIEDLRLDFEDGYGTRPDEEEDADAVLAAERVAAAVAAGVAPPFIGIRFKCFEAPTRRRGIRTLDLFLTTLAAAGPLPDGLVLTLPKVTTVDQVEAMVVLCELFEQRLGLPAGRLRFEVQMETPQLIVAADGSVPVATLLHRADGRVSALHYGTYDYSASLQIAAAYQSMEHPAADYAKQVMQVAVAETGVRISDGSTNVIPVGDPDHVIEAWTLHARLV
ncbi:MAG: aldolase, partial [Actinobacteria bacterium]|nr:aldolase [Actinomycetota bacterium]